MTAWAEALRSGVERLEDSGRHVRLLWLDVDGVVKWSAVAFGLVCAVPLASSYTPGRVGYGMLVGVLMSAAILMWQPWSRRHGISGAGMLVTAMGLWLCLSVLWGGDQRLPSLYAVILAVLSALVPWQVLRRTSCDRVTVIGLVCAAGTLGSAWAAGPLTWTAHPRLWVPRPGLPIGGASNNAVGLVVLMAGLLVMARVDRRGRPIWILLAAIDVLLVVQSVSRAGMIMALALGAFAVKRLTSSTRLALGLGVSASVTMLAVSIWVRGGVELGVGVRGSAAAHALQMWKESPLTVMFGVGSGGVWPWMVEELAWRHHRLPDSYLREGEAGEILYHAHSTYLAVLVEQGLVGGMLLAAVAALVLGSALRCIRRQQQLDLVAVAVVLGLVAMFFELYLLRSFVSSMIWWLCVWALLESGPRFDRSGRRV